VKRWLIVAALAGGAAARYAFWTEPRRLVVRRVRLSLQVWPRQLDGLRVGVISDLHAGGPHVGEERLAAVVKAMNRQATDLVVLLGDFVDPDVPFGQVVTHEAIAAQLSLLRAPLGAVAVLGNHDWAHDGDRMAAALRRAGIAVLEDDSAAVHAHGQALWLAGVGDLRERAPDVEAALAPVPSGTPVLLLSHDPDVFPSVPSRVSLTLSGHTHGGQVNLPGVRRHFIPSRFGDRYSGGHVEEGGRHLFVSRGVGSAGLPVRFVAAPEIAVLTLLSRSAAPPADTLDV
jgi:uncharacterized protein